ncbi:hypothetical protein NQK81_13205 [Amycolatopsis roodepoortensis]|uniref:hypothetical protein n=1 Tax=Amycolatopsis roodepoortensis TaxID=700274 RepID=UPI00214B6E27|nr:hypothetical protein [Amycolatopsis roodepoortensis]UUV34362.1 hypothetical protein NQK81_13205 [Amycolatopsis roodepoortensis]
MTLVDHDGRLVPVVTKIVRHDSGAAVAAITFDDREAVLDLRTASLLIANVRQTMLDLVAIEKDDGEQR